MLKRWSLKITALALKITQTKSNKICRVNKKLTKHSFENSEKKFWWRRVVQEVREMQARLSINAPKFVGDYDLYVNSSLDMCDGPSVFLTSRNADDNLILVLERLCLVYLHPYLYLPFDCCLGVWHWVQCYLVCVYATTTCPWQKEESACHHWLSTQDGHNGSVELIQEMGSERGPNRN